jgi:hypothetical protein
MTPKKCMFIAKSLTDTLHVELEPLCTGIARQLQLAGIDTSSLPHIFMFCRQAQCGTSMKF